MKKRKEGQKDHRERKSMGSVEAWRKEKRERNAKRPKQRWIESGWTREAA